MGTLCSIQSDSICAALSAVGFGHYQIEKNEIGVEDDKQDWFREPALLAQL
jgi:hypothetical protein